MTTIWTPGTQNERIICQIQAVFSGWRHFCALHLLAIALLEEKFKNFQKFIVFECFLVFFDGFTRFFIKMRRYYAQNTARWRKS